MQCVAGVSWVRWVMLLTGGGACRAVESIYEELVHEGVVIKCPKVRLADYAGEYR